VEECKPLQSGRLRVNMGNIYFELAKFPNAIKMYRMALDQIPSTAKEVGQMK
jgi:intraflagellar transport protein 88